MREDQQTERMTASRERFGARREGSSGHSPAGTKTGTKLSETEQV
jgi:hypothetical protein